MAKGYRLIATFSHHALLARPCAWVWGAARCTELSAGVRCSTRFALAWPTGLSRAAKLDLQALVELAADYEAANMPSAAADLRRRLEWYRVSLGEINSGERRHTIGIEPRT